MSSSYNDKQGLNKSKSRRQRLHDQPDYSRLERKRRTWSRSRGQFTFNLSLIKRKLRSFISVGHGFVLAGDFNNKRLYIYTFIESSICSRVNIDERDMQKPFPIEDIEYSPAERTRQSFVVRLIFRRRKEPDFAWKRNENE